LYTSTLATVMRPLLEMTESALKILQDTDRCFLPKCMQEANAMQPRYANQEHISSTTPSFTVVHSAHSRSKAHSTAADPAADNSLGIGEAAATMAMLAVLSQIAALREESIADAVVAHTARADTAGMTPTAVAVGDSMNCTAAGQEIAEEV